MTLSEGEDGPGHASGDVPTASPLLMFSFKRHGDDAALLLWLQTSGTVVVNPVAKATNEPVGAFIVLILLYMQEI